MTVPPTAVTPAKTVAISITVGTVTIVEYTDGSGECTTTTPSTSWALTAAQMASLTKAIIKLNY